MKKYPFVKQEEIKDCGVSCIEMLVKYYNGHIKREKLINLTKTGKNGTTAYHIKQALEEIGFECRGFECKFSDITKNNIVLPCIASVTINESYKHFIVIYEINFKKKHLIVGDPADKIKKMSFDDFILIFNKVILISFPIKQIPYEKDVKLLKFMSSLIHPNKKIIYNISLLSVFITLFSIITSFYLECMITGIAKYSNKFIYFIFLVFFSTYLLKIVSEYFRNVLLSYINQKIDLTLTIDTFNKIINLPYRYYHSKQTGDIISKINDIDNLRDMISKVALTIFIDLPLTFVSLIVLYAISSILFKISLIMLILYLTILFIFKNSFYEYINKLKSKKSEYTSLMIDSIKGFESIKGTHLEDNIKSKFEAKFVKFSKDIFKFQNLFYIQNLLKEFINNIGFITIIFVGCLLVIKDKMNIGSLLTFSSLLFYFIDPIKNIINLDITFKESKVSLKRIIELIHYDEKDNGIINEFRNGDIKFKDVEFTFDDRKKVLSNVSLHIKQTSKIMVIGKSGSGKSTLFKLLMKYYSINNGKIFIDNIDINDYKIEAINKSIVYVSQNEMLFNDTVYNNIIFNSNDKSKLLSISKICEIDEILDYNLKFNMLIEENGFNLSGGQKQRIILARALMQNFDILIIDEALNQIDIDLERKIIKNILNTFKDKTIIVISHRLDNLDLFDSLIKFENGQVKEVKRNG